MLATPETIVAPFVFDCLQAKLAVSAGFDAVYMTGFGTAAAHGYLDLGLLTMTEMAANARAISRSVNVPTICDADTGYGNPLNVWRTVREYEDAGMTELKRMCKLSVGTGSNVFEDFIRVLGIEEYQALEKKYAD